jgi:nucleotide-binding universal stress UspA family protein
MFKHILIPLDGSTLAEAVLPYAVELCKKMNSKVTLLHIIEKDASPEIHGQHHLTAEPEACDYLGRIAESQFSFCSSVERHVHTEEVSQVPRSIVEHSGEFSPDLIILCAHGAGGLRDIVAGSIAQQVIASGKVPVLLVHPGEPFNGIKTILVALDGDPDHDQSLEVAGELATAFEASLRLVRVVPTYGTLSGEQAALGTMLPATTAAYLEMMEEEAVEYLQQKLDSFCHAAIDCEAEVQRGDPVQEVVKSAINSNANVIILGTHGKSGLNAFWSGSVAPKIVAKTKLPVLLVPVRRA